jgi:hypothetical protein
MNFKVLTGIIINHIFYTPYMSIKFFGKKYLKVRIPPYCENKFSGKILENSEYLYVK